MSKLAGMSKPYDLNYFNHWYRNPATRVVNRAALARRVSLAVGLAEFALQRPVRSVLDIGCGEGAWRSQILKLRPKASYLGLDSSEYAIARYGKTRNLAYARFAELDTLRPGPPADLLVCADVMHYVPAQQLQRGIRGFDELCRGIAYLECFCKPDQIEGDTEGFIPRHPDFYRRLIEAQGFKPFGPFTWLSPVLVDEMTALALPRLATTS